MRMTRLPPKLLPDPAPPSAEGRSYHHGDLRAALLAAAEDELAARGVEGFSLRQVAKRAGVSHAAPAHHFGDAAGLLQKGLKDNPNDLEGWLALGLALVGH
eukprot:gene3443-4542_t